MRRNISNVLLCVIGAPLFGSTLAPRRSIVFRNSTGTWSRAPGKQFGVLDRWRDRHTRPARWSDTLRTRPVRWRKWNRIRIDLARLADPILYMVSRPSHQCLSLIGMCVSACIHIFIYNIWHVAILTATHMLQYIALYHSFCWWPSAAVCHWLGWVYTWYAVIFHCLWYVKFKFKLFILSVISNSNSDCTVNNVQKRTQN